MAKKQDKTPGVDEAVDMAELIKALGLDDAAGKDTAAGDAAAGKDDAAGKDAVASDAAAADVTAGKKTTAGSDAASDADADSDDAGPVAQLKACAARLAKPHEFKPGQLIRWKKGLKNKRSPAYGEPLIVVEVLADPVMDDEVKNAGSPYFREPLTIIAGEVDKDGDFICFHYDARRFEPYTG